MSNNLSNSEAKSFVEKLLNEVWLSGNSANVAKYYAESLKGQFNSTPINYHDIKNRVDYVNANQKNPHIKVEDVVASENKISFRYKLSFVDSKDNKSKESNNIAIYHLDDRDSKKIQGIWVVSEENTNYKERS